MLRALTCGCMNHLARYDTIGPVVWWSLLGLWLLSSVPVVSRKLILDGGACQFHIWVYCFQISCSDLTKYVDVHMSYWPLLWPSTLLYFEENLPNGYMKTTEYIESKQTHIRYARRLVSWLFLSELCDIWKSKIGSNQSNIVIKRCSGSGHKL